MKLIIYFLLIIGMFNNVYAEEWSEWSDKVPIKENITVETEKRYKWYREEKIDKGYINPNIQNCKNLDKKDMKKEKHISVKLPEMIKGRIVKSYYNEDYNSINYFDSIFINNISIDNESGVDFTELEIYDKSSKKIVPYKMSNSVKFDKGKVANLYDGKKDVFGVKLKGNNYLLLYLERYYNVNDIELRFYFLQKDFSLKSFNLTTRHNKHFDASRKSIKDFSNVLSCEKSKCVIKLPLENYIAKIDEYRIYNAYEYEDILYKCYENKKEYLDGYYKNIVGYKKDENTEKIFYRYKNGTESCDYSNCLCESEIDKFKLDTELNIINKYENVKPQSIIYKKLPHIEEKTVDNKIADVVLKNEDKINKKNYNKKRILIIGIILCIITTIVVTIIYLYKKYVERSLSN